MSVTSYTSSGNKATAEVKLPKNVFAVEIKNHDLLKDAYLAYMANGRENLAKTLKRGEVRGGGRKPWQQKGTGRARFGSIRNPIWRGGGIAFGPSGNENYSRKLNIKAKRIALCQALTMCAKDKNLIIIQELKLASNKTKSAATLLKKLNAEYRCLMVVDKVDNKLQSAFNNIQGVKLVSVKNLNVFDTLNCSNLVIDVASISQLELKISGAK
ncbi:MAG: 50S ribosomal protein L4 [Candidatus Saccharibacteria bacterium]